jgi:iron complex outermembrane receptor protein
MVDRQLAGFAAMMLLASTSVSALAQTAATQPEARDEGQREERTTEGLADIIVTGQKRAGSVDVQKVASAVSAFDENTIRQTFATDIKDLGRLAPSVQLNDSGTFKGFANFYIRGVGLSLTVRTQDPAVGTFVDGIYVGYGPMSVLDTFGVASMEVFRGPQGTLFGRNVTGGAVNILTARPTQEFEGSGRITVGNYDRVGVAGMINVPLTDTLAARVSAYSNSQDGFFTNLVTGNTIGDENTRVFRPALRWRPTPELDLQLLGEYMRSKGGTSAVRALDSRINPRLLGPNFVPTPATAQSVFGYTPPVKDYEVNFDFDGYSNSKVYQAIFDGSYDMGHGIATLITGYRHVTYNSSTDFDGTPFPVFSFPDNRENQKQFSSELRYASKFSDVVEFTAGLYYFTQKLFVGERRAAYTGGGAANPIISRTASLTEAKDDSIAGFAEGRVHFTPTLTAIVGGRYTHEKKRILVCPQSAVNYALLDFANCPTRLTGEKSWNAFSPKAGVEWQANPDTLAYVTYTKGFRSGNFNGRAGNLIQLGPVDPETVASFEGGLKLKLLNNRIHFNNAVYYSDYKNMQRTINEYVVVNGVSTLQQIPRNAAAARIWGLESELQFQVTDALQFDASGSYTNARYNRFANIDANRNGLYEPGIDDALATKLKFERVPKWQFATSATYTVPMLNGATSLRAAYAYVSHAFTDVINSPDIDSDAYGLLDASITYNDDRKFRISAYVRNLTDKHYVVIGTDGGTDRHTYLGNPRTFGVDLGFEF